MDRLEAAGVLVSRPVGSTREYEFNPRYAARTELKSLLNRALVLYPAAMKDALLLSRAVPDAEANRCEASRRYVRGRACRPRLSGATRRRHHRDTHGGRRQVCAHR